MRIEKKKILLLSVVLLLVFSMSACQTLSNLGLSKQSSIVHDELFTYDVSYDRAYLRVIEAAELVPAWILSGTDQRAGTITLRSTGFSNDAEVTVIIKRISKEQTSIELAPDSQRVKGVEDILKAIDKLLLK